MKRGFLITAAMSKRRSETSGAPNPLRGMKPSGVPNPSRTGKTAPRGASSPTGEASQEMDRWRAAEKTPILMASNKKPKRVGPLFISIAIILCCFITERPKNVYSADSRIEPDADRTLAPYLFIEGQEKDSELLPLKSTFVKVSIAGVIADVSVTQEYQNNGQAPLEAVYVFPAGSRAAVYAMKMQIGARTVVAKIKERQKARKEYQEAKQAGKRASLLEQQRPNVFQMNVANILPDDAIKVELKYTELLVPQDGRFEFVFPTVVGPRYSKTKALQAQPAQSWVEYPFFQEGESPLNTFDIDVQITAGLPVKKIRCLSHNVDIRYQSKDSARVRLSANEISAGNKDFILSYRLTENKIESGLLLFPGAEENYFLLLVEPPPRPKFIQIALGSARLCEKCDENDAQVRSSTAINGSKKPQFTGPSGVSSATSTTCTSRLSDQPTEPPNK